MEPRAAVVCDDAPSSESFSLVNEYRVLPHLDRGHTHRTYATAWAARGEPIPCLLTAQVDEFGGEIPIDPFPLIDGDDTGKGIVVTQAQHRCPAVLMTNHGVFANGRDAARGREGGGYARGPGTFGPPRPATRRTGAPRVDGR
jgi:L-ribulose-5-phosphate 4-epimerase